MADHTRCLDEGMCKGDSIIEGIAFRCLHTNDCDGACLAKSPPMEKVKSIIKEGEIPLITCSLTNLDELQLDVIKAAQSTDYTAINHVWADGLGMNSFLQRWTTFRGLTLSRQQSGECNAYLSAEATFYLPWCCNLVA